MIALIAAVAVLTAVRAEPTAYELGKASVFAGMCTTLGWDTTQERVVAYAEAYEARNPAAGTAEGQAEIARGIQDAQTDMQGLIATFQATGDATVFKQAISSRCDAVVRDVPEVLSRTATTQAVFDQKIAEIIGGMGAANPQH